MISYDNGYFRLETDHTGYYFRVTKFLHLESIYYGERLIDKDLEPLSVKHTVIIGTQTAYDPSDPMYALDTYPLEWSGIGKGDYRHSPSEIEMPDETYTNDFRYVSHRIVRGNLKPSTLPCSYGSEDECETLEITLTDEPTQVTLLMYYTVYPAQDVITRRVSLCNHNEKTLVIRKLMSMMIDLPNRDYQFITLHGGWIREARRQVSAIDYGLRVNESLTGCSSNRHNPGFLLAASGATETSGMVFGFNLIYSGNHYSAVEKSERDLIRVMSGIHPQCFAWPLHHEEVFETPEVVMTVSCEGFGGTSDHFHNFVREHITRGDWKDQERPVLFNSWEARSFHFNESSLLSLARQAKRLGMELFVLDDGWFGDRDDDTRGLGDYTVNLRKLPGGLPRLAERLKKIGLRFGLWFEPEMVNPNSDLFRAHPEYAVRIPGREPSMGRNQLTLDLTNPDVREYIISHVSDVLDSCDISYVKWDMNRNMSDMYSPTLDRQGTFGHRYILGLYEVLTRIFVPRPKILLETCASGGNRFDLGMLCFSPQIWVSDNTDPAERLDMQGNLSLLYPLSSMGAHVSSAPHQQTLRDTTLVSRFNTASFGSLGYELDLSFVSRAEKQEIKEQVRFYKEHRTTFQYGRFYRHDPHKDNKVHWSVVSKDKEEAIVGFFQTRSFPAEGIDHLPISGLDPEKTYQVRTRPQRVYVRRFGELINFLLPVRIHPRGFVARLIDRWYRMYDAVETYSGSGRLLMSGIPLYNAFSGTYFNDKTRLLLDFGSNLYTVRTMEHPVPTEKE